MTEGLPFKINYKAAVFFLDGREHKNHKVEQRQQTQKSHDHDLKTKEASRQVILLVYVIFQETPEYKASLINQVAFYVILLQDGRVIH